MYVREGHVISSTPQHVYCTCTFHRCINAYIRRQVCISSVSSLPLPPQQCTVLREGQQGFTFESNRGSRVEVKAESSTVQFDFAPRNPWCTGKKTYKTKQELLEEKVVAAL